LSEFSQGDKLSPAVLNQKTVYVGSGEPSTKYDGQIWVDVSTDPPIVKVYDLSNTQWMTYHPTYYEEQSGAWADPSVSPVTDGTLVVVYNSTEDETRLYGYSNDAWVNLAELTISVIPVFEKYYEGTLAAGATYTPADEGLYSMSSNDSGYMRFEIYGDTKWIMGAESGETFVFFGDGTHLRVKNYAGDSHPIVLMRAKVQHMDPSYTWSGGSLAASSTLVLTSPGVYSIAPEEDAFEFQGEYYHSTDGWLKFSDSSNNHVYTMISDGSNARLRNRNSSTAYEYGIVRWS